MMKNLNRRRPAPPRLFVVSFILVLCFIPSAWAPPSRPAFAPAELVVAYRGGVVGVARGAYWDGGCKAGPGSTARGTSFAAWWKMCGTSDVRGCRRSRAGAGGLFR